MIIKSAYIEITNRCNLDCRDCYNSSGRNRKTVELDPDVLLRFITDLKVRYHVRAITLSGGEPLLHTQIDRILKSISELSVRCPEMDFNFITNGTLDNALFYELMERNPHFYLQISLDGPNEAANASMRGPGVFSKVMANTGKRVFCNRPVYKMVLNKTNAAFFEEYFWFVMELGGLPSFAFVTPQGNAAANWAEMQLSVQERADIILRIKQLYEEHGIENVSLPMPASHCDLTDAEPQNNFCVKPDGSLQPCQNLYDSRFALANVYSLDWEALAQTFQTFSSFLASRLSTDYGCGKCPLNVVCGRGCPALSYFRSGDLLSSDGACEIRKISAFHLIKAFKK